MPPRIEDWEMEDYLRIFWSSRKLIVACGLAGVCFSTFSALQKPNLYRATARVLIEPQSPRVVRFEEVARPEISDRTFLQTEYEIIGSRAIMARVVEDLHLASFPPFSSSEDPARVLRGMISVQPIRGTKLVDISSGGTNPELIIQLVNAVAESYTKMNLERRREMTTGGAQWLSEEVEKMEGKMRDAQLRLLKFREEHGAIDLGEETQNSTLQRLQALHGSLNKIREDRLDAELKYREKHPALQELLAKERELQLVLFDQEQRTLEISRLSIQFNTLMREAKTSESVYNILLTRLKELGVQEGLQSNNVSVVDLAEPPLRSIGPARGRNVLSGLLLGLLLGGALGLAREYLTRTIRNRQEFERLLEIPFLGHVPLLPRAGQARNASYRIVMEQPTTAAAEAFRSARTTLEFLLSSGTSHCLVVTSSLPEEGKTTVSANLALALNELDRRVLLVDGDLRRPSLHRHLGVELEPGLSGYLLETAQLAEIAQPVPGAEGLSFIPAGLSPPQPADLLNHPRLREAILQWKKEYQYVLIDSSPILVAVDAAVLSTLAEGVLLVVRANRTHTEVLSVGKQRLVDVGAKLIGGILNGANLQHEHGYRYYYSYGPAKGRRRSRPTTTPLPVVESSPEETPL